jgi:hypothetical protein
MIEVNEYVVCWEYQNFATGEWIARLQTVLTSEQADAMRQHVLSTPGVRNVRVKGRTITTSPWVDVT